MQFATLCEDCVFIVWAYQYFSLWGGSSMQNESGAIRLVYPSFFCKLRSSFKPTNKSNGFSPRARFKQLYPVTIKNSIYVHMNFSSSQWSTLSNPKMLTFPLESPCIKEFFFCLAMRLLTFKQKPLHIVNIYQNSWHRTLITGKVRASSIRQYFYVATISAL